MDYYNVQIYFTICPMACVQLFGVDEKITLVEHSKSSVGLWVSAITTRSDTSDELINFLAKQFCLYHNISRYSVNLSSTYSATIWIIACGSLSR